MVKKTFMISDAEILIQDEKYKEALMILNYLADNKNSMINITKGELDEFLEFLSTTYDEILDKIESAMNNYKKAIKDGLDKHRLNTASEILACSRKIDNPLKDFKSFRVDLINFMLFLGVNQEYLTRTIPPVYSRRGPIYGYNIYEAEGYLLQILANEGKREMDLKELTKNLKTYESIKRLFISGRQKSQQAIDLIRTQFMVMITKIRVAIDILTRILNQEEVRSASLKKMKKDLKDVQSNMSKELVAFDSKFG